MAREIIFYGPHFEDFLAQQPPKVRAKVVYVLKLIQELDRVPQTYLKHLSGTDGLYEIRVQFAGNIYRIFCFFDEGNLVILLNAFQKKTQKTPRKEIKLAERLKQAYYESKQT
ncbi:MAG: type II toxin-antitoxin system RelE/ParE family toxin [Bacteroidota bacterium]